VLASVTMGATVLAACGGAPSSGHQLATVHGIGTNWGASAPGAPACNPLGGQSCMLPFPSDYYTVPDRTMPSGRRVAFPTAAMPANAAGAHIDPTAWGANDGFSPGSVIEVQVPGLDAARTGLADQNHVPQSLASNAPIVLLDATTGRRLAWWAEPDARAPNPATALLLIHPAANLPEGHRIVVALRDLRTSSGTPIAPTGTFADVVAGRPAPGPTGATITAHLQRMLTVLHTDAGVSTRGLYLAWDFTVDSTANLTGWALHMRDVAMGALHGGVPAYQVTAVHDLTPLDTGGRTIARQITGTIDVPDFLNGPSGDQSATFRFGAGGMPTTVPGAVEHAVFSCLVPRSVDATPATAGAAVTPGRPVLYGKGLFSVATQMDAVGERDLADRYRMVLCSVNWLGLDGNDLLNDATLLVNLSTFPSLPDHLQQSMIDALYLGRLMASPHGFAANPAFEGTGTHTPFIDTSTPLTYYGNSEGSLMGGAVTAISTQWHRAVLGVPSMDYAILLPRSVDFTSLYAVLDRSYPTEQTQQLIFDILQMLWDRGETDGYVEQLAGHPLPGTPSHQVLLQMGFGDHQVANVTTVIEARTLGAVVHRPVLPPGLVGGDPFAGLPAAGTSSRVAATLYVWEDPNIPPPPIGNVPPSTGIDPHGFIPRSLPAAQQQLAGFLATGTVTDVCGASPCTTTATSAVHLVNPTP
jgi:hypothetical protein